MNKLFFTVITVILLTSCKSKQSTVSTSTTNTGKSASTYWQQHVDYTMNIDMDMKNYQFDGTQKLVYTNNSPDDLHVVFLSSLF